MREPWCPKSRVAGVSPKAGWAHERAASSGEGPASFSLAFSQSSAGEGWGVQRERPESSTSSCRQWARPGGQSSGTLSHGSQTSAAGPLPCDPGRLTDMKETDSYSPKCVASFSWSKQCWPERSETWCRVGPMPSSGERGGGGFQKAAAERAPWSWCQARPGAGHESRTGPRAPKETSLGLTP